jgi:hypothetical protein
MRLSLIVAALGKLSQPFCVRSGRKFVILQQDNPLLEEWEKTMITFALAQELKNAGFTPSKNTNAVYFINDHLKIRREDALRMWYGDKAKFGNGPRSVQGGCIFSDPNRTHRGLQYTVLSVVH